MSDLNNMPMPEQEQPQEQPTAQQSDNTQPAYQQAAPQYQEPQTPFYGQPSQQYTQPTQQYTQQSSAYGTYGQQTTASAVPLDQPHYGCSLTEAFTRFWKKYGTFKGRASRSEFWWWILCAILIAIAINIVFGMLKAVFPGSNSGIMHMTFSTDATSIYTSGNSSNSAIATLQSIVTLMWWIATIVPTIALSVRRLHDINKPGWWLAIYYVAQALLAVVMIVIVIVAIASAANRYFYSYGYGYDRSDVINSIITSSGGALICLVLMLALWVTYIVFMALPSKPEGARFDAVAPGYTPNTYAAPSYAAYAQTGAYATPVAPTAPAAPATSTDPNASMPAAPAATYEQAAEVPATPVAPNNAASEEYNQPEQTAVAPVAPSQPEQPAADSNVQQPWQGQQ